MIQNNVVDIYTRCRYNDIDGSEAQIEQMNPFSHLWFVVEANLLSDFRDHDHK